MLTDEIGRTFFLYMDLIGKNPWPIVDVFWWKLHDPRWERVTNKQIKTRRWVAIRCVSQYVPYGINVLVSIIAYSRYISAIHVQDILYPLLTPECLGSLASCLTLCFDDLHISMAIYSFDPFPAVTNGSVKLYPTPDPWLRRLDMATGEWCSKINNRSRVNRKKHIGNFSRYVNLSLSFYLYTYNYLYI